MKTIKLNASVTASNDRDADALRARLNRDGKLLVNVMSSAGSGKTTLLSAIIRDLPQIRFGVMEADIESDVDAQRIDALGAKAIQVHTSGMCHMDAGMTTAAYDALEADDAELLFLENVGNLICPAEYDTGAQVNLMILSVPEGDDKPLKYPLMFQKSDVLVISKTDALPYFSFDLSKCSQRVLHLNPKIRIFPVSAKTGDGMQALEAWLIEQLNRIRTNQNHPLNGWFAPAL
ncbi:MAG: hydrogenase nickel incorporation protein HypB [Clostridia bacterium]|nr:hydrogenase nickel incorporation protein HypB [Clostridia bacterium]